MSNEKIHTTTTCKFCNGQYIPYSQCPKYGLKFRNSPCPIGEITVKYKEVKVRNNVPFWKFWKKHYEIKNLIVD